MTRARWIQSAASLFALWLVGALVCLPHLQRDLETAALDVLAQQPALRHRMSGLHLEFSGQQARLSGSVRTPQDRSLIESTMSDRVRVPAPFSLGFWRHLNPVSSVRSELEVVPSPPGWMLLAANGGQARLLGTAANAYEARDLAHGVQNAWSTRGGSSDGMPGSDAENHDEAASVSATLRSVPAPPTGVQAYLARIGQSWQELTLGQSDEDLRAAALALGVSEEEWQQQVLPALNDLRATQQRQHIAQAENERLAHLPVGYLFLAVRDQQVILRGEVGTAEVKRGVLADALAAFAPRRLHDEIRVSALRRPTDDFGPITTALLPEEGKVGGKSCFLSFSGEAWKPVDWQTAPSEQSWKHDLPAGVTGAFLPRPNQPGGLASNSLLSDSTLLSNWLQGDDSHAPAPPQPTDPAFVTLALFGTKAILSGQVAEEAVRAQLIAAVRQAYSPPLLVTCDDLHVRGDCEPSGRILHTLKSLPRAPAAGSAGLFAIASPGSTWKSIPVTRPLVEAGGLAQSGQLPAGIPAARVEELSAEAIEQLRLHLAHSAFH